MSVSDCMPAIPLWTLMLISGLQAGHAQVMPADMAAEASRRNANYAPWDPARMPELRRQVGLIGPGPRSPVPEAAFPDYLKKPATVEGLMPQALAAVTQKGGRSPLGLAEPGDVVLIVVPYDADRLIQQAMRDAFRSRRIEARILYENDLVGISAGDMQSLDEAKNLFEGGDKYMGNYTYINHYDLMGRSPNVPADVWRMLEGKLIDPLGFVDRYEVSDPEGTAMYGDVTPGEARIWAEGAYQQGHLYMLPSQSGGRYPYSRVNYPAVGNTWLEPVQGRTHGVIASTNSHASNHARVEVHLQDGYMDRIAGGGLYGDGMRLSLAYPGINEPVWPGNDKPGFWWLYEAGTGTNPKYFKHPREILLGQNLSERNAGGVIHWSFGVSAGGADGERFRSEKQLPTGHAMHHHTLLPTYQVRLRDSGNWLTLIEHGIIQTYHDPEVRALASRYGNPDEILRRDWIPELPGITRPGDYNADYAADPGRFWTDWAHEIENGTNPYLKGR